MNMFEFFSIKETLTATMILFAVIDIVGSIPIIVSLKKKFGKNAVLKGMNLVEGATTASRNRQIGGHKA